jgi:hypothetical protein
MESSTTQPAPTGASADASPRLTLDRPTSPVAGWRLNFVAGFVPLAAGLTTLMTTWIGIGRTNSAWWTGVGRLDFSYSSLSRAGREAPAWVQLSGSIGGVNIVAGAVAVIVVARFGLRGGQRWAWWFLAFCLLWVGLHDATMATRFFHATGQPLLVLPYTYCVLMLAGLLRSRRAIFAAPDDLTPVPSTQ